MCFQLLAWLKLRERTKKGHGKGGFGSDSGLCESVQQQVAEIMFRLIKVKSECAVVGDNY